MREHEHTSATIKSMSISQCIKQSILFPSGYGVTSNVYTFFKRRIKIVNYYREWRKIFFFEKYILPFYCMFIYFIFHVGDGVHVFEMFSLGFTSTSMLSAWKTESDPLINVRCKRSSCNLFYSRWVIKNEGEPCFI